MQKKKKTDLIKYCCPSSVYAASQLLGKGPKLEVLLARSNDLCLITGTASLNGTGEDLDDDISELLGKRFFPSE